MLCVVKVLGCRIYFRGKIMQIIKLRVLPNMRSFL
nr:MAG TPA: hypothetical protein [Bacteriophage sp.]